LHKISCNKRANILKRALISRIPFFFPQVYSQHQFLINTFHPWSLKFHFCHLHLCMSLWYWSNWAKVES
jgi:hypothetical protein